MAGCAVCSAACKKCGKQTPQCTCDCPASTMGPDCSGMYRRHGYVIVLHVMLLNVCNQDEDRKAVFGQKTFVVVTLSPPLPFFVFIPHLFPLFLAICLHYFVK